MYKEISTAYFLASAYVDSQILRVFDTKKLVRPIFASDAAKLLIADATKITIDDGRVHLWFTRPFDEITVDERKMERAGFVFTRHSYSYNKRVERWFLSNGEFAMMIVAHCLADYPEEED